MAEEVVVKKIPLYAKIARTCQSVSNCIATGNTEWESRHEAKLKELLDHLPHGSGIDGTWSAEYSVGKLKLFCQYHHMNEGGYYDGWTEFTVVVSADLAFGMTIRVIGGFPRKYSDTRDYLAEVMSMALEEMVEAYS